mgnify:CR=1 FL=1
MRPRLRISLIIAGIASTIFYPSCAGPLLNSEAAKPIANPFHEYSHGYSGDPQRDPSDPIVMHPNSDRTPASENSSTNPVNYGTSTTPDAADAEPIILDESYRHQRPGLTDQEIIRSLPHPPSVQLEKQEEIERGLNLIPSTDGASDQSNVSYLASIDFIKQLFKNSRYEVALIEADKMLLRYPADPHLYEMRGTLLDHLGQRDLALRSWSQALHFNPKNSSLRKFIARKQLRPREQKP